MTRSFASIGAALLLIQGPWAGAQDAPQAIAGAPRTLTLEDSESVKLPESLALSRDGRQVAYVLDDRIYVVPTAGGVPRPVTAPGSRAWDPYWSKDGSALYFLSNRADGNQLWKLTLGSFGEATQVTKFERGIDGLDLSPDESKLLMQFTATDLKKADEKGEAGAAADAGGKKPFVITRLEFKEDSGEGYLTGDLTEHLHVFDVADRQACAGHVRRILRVGDRLVSRRAPDRLRQQSREGCRRELQDRSLDRRRRQYGPGRVARSPDERRPSEEQSRLESGRRLDRIPDGRGRRLRQSAARGDARIRRRAADPHDGTRPLGERFPLFPGRAVDLLHL